MGSACYSVLPSFPLLSACSIPKVRVRKNLSVKSQSSAVTPPIHTPSIWHDVAKFCQTQQEHGSSDLRGFFDKVKLCNRNSEKQFEFIPFVIEEQIVGYVHNGDGDVNTFQSDCLNIDRKRLEQIIQNIKHKRFPIQCTYMKTTDMGIIDNEKGYKFAHHLKRYKDVFAFHENPAYSSKWGYHVELHPALVAPEDRTKAVGEVVKCLGEELIPGTRNELYPVRSSFETPEFFLLERAAAPYFGIKVYGVHMNGYVERANEKYLWIGKRSQVKSTYPGKLDHLVAGGLPHGISCEENIMKECEEEAGIPRSISSKATSVGAVSYLDIDGYRLKRDVLYCYDLKLPEGFVPVNQDGEVESFNLVPIVHVANIIRNTTFFKDNCNLVIIDFLFRHGYIKPEGLGYLKLLQSLRTGDCT